METGAGRTPVNSNFEAIPYTLLSFAIRYIERSAWMLPRATPKTVRHRSTE